MQEYPHPCFQSLHPSSTTHSPSQSLLLDQIWKPPCQVTKCTQCHLRSDLCFLFSMTQVFVAGYVYHLIQIKIRPTLSSLCTQNILWKEKKKSNISKHIMLKRLWQQNLITQLSTFLLRGFNQAYKCVTSSTIPFYLFTA